jgi:hypothetical protein
MAAHRRHNARPGSHAHPASLAAPLQLASPCRCLPSCVRECSPENSALRHQSVSPRRSRSLSQRRRAHRPETDPSGAGTACSPRRP